MASVYTLTPDDRAAVIETSARLGIEPQTLVSVIGYETMGTMNPGIRGGTGGNYEGLIQFGPTERRTYGYEKGMTFADQVRGPVYNYLADRGVGPGMGIAHVYSIINAGSLKNGAPRWNASDRPGHNVRTHAAAIERQYLPLADAVLNGGTFKGSRAASGGDVLKLGAGTRTNPDPRVADLQQRLASKGLYKGAIDGIFGRGTENAVRAYQSVMRLDVDGKAGPETLRSLGVGSGQQSIDLTGIPVEYSKTPLPDKNRLPDVTRDIGFGAMPAMNSTAFPEMPTAASQMPAPFSDRAGLAPAGPDVLNPYGSRAPAGSMPLPTVDPRKDIAGPFTPATPGTLPDFLNFFPSQASGVPLPNLDPRREAMGPAQADIPLPPTNPRRDASGAFPPAGIMPGNVLAGGPQGATATGVLDPMAPAQLAGSAMAGAGQGASTAGILSPSAAPQPLSGFVMAGGPQGAAATGILDLLGPAPLAGSVAGGAGQGASATGSLYPAIDWTAPPERSIRQAVEAVNSAPLQSAASAAAERSFITPDLAGMPIMDRSRFDAANPQTLDEWNRTYGLGKAMSDRIAGMPGPVAAGTPLAGYEPPPVPVAAGTPLAGYEPTPPTPQRTIDFDFATAPSPRGSMPTPGPNFGWAGPNFDAAGARETIDRVLQDILGITGSSPAVGAPMPYQNTTVGAPKLNEGGLPVGIYGTWSPGGEGSAAASPALAQRNAVSAPSSQPSRASSSPVGGRGVQTETSYRSNAAPTRSEMNRAGPSYTIDEVVSRSREATDPMSIGFLERRDMGYDPLSSIRTPTVPGAPAGGIKDWFGATPIPMSPPPGVAIVKASPVPVAPPMPLAPVRPAAVAPPAVPVATNKAKTGKVGAAERLLVNLGLIGPGSILGRVGGGKGKSAADIIGSLIGSSYTPPPGSTVSRANFDPVSGGSRYDVYTSPSGVKSYTTSGGNTFITYDPTYGGLPGAPSADAGTLGSSSNTVLCTYFMQKGWLPRDLWQADSDFAKTLPKSVRRTYWRWAIPAVRRLRAGDERLERLLWPIVKAWAHYAGWRMGIVPRRPVLGTIVHHICSTARFSRLMRSALG